jgi:hypothetical protein
MSPINSSATAGLTVLGLVVGPAATLMMAFAADPIADPGTAAPAAFHAPTTVPPNAEREYSVLLKTSGQVIQGRITKTETGYRLRTKVGEIPYGRREVEAVFGSLAEAYEYKNSRTPTHDPDERMKLAQWCLTNGLTGQAKAELERVLDLNPQHRRAKGMLFQIDAVASREPKRDNALVRSSVEMPRQGAPAVVDPDAPGILDMNDLREEYRRNPQGGGVPVILDLPAPQAIRRYQQFAQRVHPILQKHCAGCHNERTPGSFLLYQAKGRRDLGNDLIIRANLDAALRLVNPDDPAKSTLLTSSLMPHPPKNQPIFLGPNQLSYRELAAWVTSLKASPEPVDPGVREASYQSEGEAPAEAFAVDRRGGTPERTTAKSQPAGSRLNLSADRPDPQFPTDPLLGGPDAAKIKLRTQPAPGGVGAAPTVTTDDEGAPVMKVNGVEIPIDTRADPKTSPKIAKPAAKKAKSKLDPAALQRLMQQRNAPR